MTAAEKKSLPKLECFQCDSWLISIGNRMGPSKIKD